MNRSIALLVTALTMLALALCCCTTDFDWQSFFFAATPTAESPDVTPGTTPPPDQTPGPERTPWPTPEPGSGLEAETEYLLATTNTPARDLHELAIRLYGLPPDTPRTINSAGSPDYPVGTRRLFHVSNTDTDEQFDIYAILHYKTDHVYMWVEEGERFDQDDLEAAADRFEEDTYPTNRAFFGSEWTPGVDNDPHVSILHAHNLGSVGGYFSSSDEFVAAVREDSNEMEMFVISLDYEIINGSDYNGVLAHEFQHMIHWYHDRNETTWMNEGCSELAQLLNGFDAGSDWAFASLPDNQLTDIDYDSPDAYAGYGAGYLFMAYFLDRFGPEATQALVAHEENSMASVDAVLADLGTGITHVDLFADWIVANLLDDTSIAEGQYGYDEIDTYSFSIEEGYDESDYPVSEEADVHQYGTDYLELRGEDPLVFRFAGSTQTRLVDTAAHSGQYIWWANRNDDSDTTLTRAFDLSGFDEATFEFWTWYDIEENWDYAYVEISTDGGMTWEILTTPSGTDADPNGNSFGWGYTDVSGNRRTPEWIQEQVNISAYTGQEIMIRFEYITDDAVLHPGFAVDDIAIPEIGYFSDFEEGDDGWEAAGFIRHANVLSQRWLLQLILFGRETTVQRLDLSDDMTGEWTVPLDGGTERAVITISAMAPVTTETAPYLYEIEME